MSFHKPSDRRDFGRRQTFRPAVVQFDSQEMACSLTEWSDAGARLQIGENEELPQQFRLVIEDADVCVDCEQIHKSGGMVGVRFLRSPRRLSWLRNRRSR